MSGHSDNSENSGGMQVIAFLYKKKNDKSEFFYDTWNCLEVTIPSSELSIFVIYQNITWNFTFAFVTMLGEVKSYHFLHYTENSNSEFSKPAKAFNLANIVQACQVLSQTHRVNKDVSNSVKD